MLWMFLTARQLARKRRQHPTDPMWEQARSRPLQYLPLEFHGGWTAQGNVVATDAPNLTEAEATQFRHVVLRVVLLKHVAMHRVLLGMPHRYRDENMLRAFRQVPQYLRALAGCQVFEHINHHGQIVPVIEFGDELQGVHLIYMVVSDPMNVGDIRSKSLDAIKAR